MLPLASEAHFNNFVTLGTHFWESKNWENEKWERPDFDLIKHISTAVYHNIQKSKQVLRSEKRDFIVSKNAEWRFQKNSEITDGHTE